MPLCDKCNERKDLVKIKKGGGKHCHWHDTKGWRCDALVVYSQAKICEVCSRQFERCEICLASLRKIGFFQRLLGLFFK